MLIDFQPPATGSSGIIGAIQKAASATGTNFRYLLAAAKVESNLDPNAAAKSSSAGGLFQFIEQTWLGTLKESGEALGYGRYANAIERNATGRFDVADPALRSEILNLRRDPAANAAMAGAFTRSNANFLSQRLGRSPTDGELYMAHFLGARGALKMITLANATPNAAAADAFPRAAGANASIFYAQDGRPRSLADVVRKLAGRYDGAIAATAVAANGLPGAAAPTERARVAGLYESASPTAARRVSADGNSQYLFGNPYRSARTPQPVAAPAGTTAVAPTTAATSTSNPPPVRRFIPFTPGVPMASVSANGEGLGLFQDMKPNVRALFTGT